MKVTYYLASSTSMNKIPFITGNLIFSSNERKIYFDDISGRVAYDGITRVSTEARRQALPSTTHTGFYFVTETKKLWFYYDGQWSYLGGGDEPEPGEKQVEFLPYEDFPAMGETEKLYVDGNAIYVWSDTDEDYIQISSDGEQDWIII